jgi:hypothetical protein
MTDIPELSIGDTSAPIWIKLDKMIADALTVRIMLKDRTQETSIKISEPYMNFVSGET